MLPLSSQQVFTRRSGMDSARGATSDDGKRLPGNILNPLTDLSLAPVSCPSPGFYGSEQTFASGSGRRV